ncbi:MAG: hypothetical protein ACPGEC_03095 [Flavobacteriales bacterium]
MKHLIIIFGFLAYGCNQSDKNIEQENKNKQLKQDSITAVKVEQARLEKVRQDSIIAIEQDKVIGDIKFGMTKKDVKLKIEKFKKENRRPDKFLGEPHYDDFIGEYEYFQILDYYYEGKLYGLNINGNLIDWEKYDSEVPRQIKYITDVISQKYGDPSLHYELPPRYELQKGYSYLINRWNIGKKRIEIKVLDTGTRYPVNVEIFLPEVIEEIKKEREQQEQESVNKAKEVF